MVVCPRYYLYDRFFSVGFSYYKQNEKIRRSSVFIGGFCRDLACSYVRKKQIKRKSYTVCRPRTNATAQILHERIPKPALPLTIHTIEFVFLSVLSHEEKTEACVKGKVRLKKEKNEKKTKKNEKQYYLHEKTQTA